MSSVILIALILLFICTAAGLIFLAVTVSDNADKDGGDNADTALSDKTAAGGAFAAYAAAHMGKKQKGYSYTKRSDVNLWGTKTRIVNTALKGDFEKTLAQMSEKPEPPPPAVQEAEIPPEEHGDDTDQEFIDVLDLIPESAENAQIIPEDTEGSEEPEGVDLAKEPAKVPNDGLSETENEFLISEELLR